MESLVQIATRNDDGDAPPTTPINPVDSHFSPDSNRACTWSFVAIVLRDPVTNIIDARIKMPRRPRKRTMASIDERDGLFFSLGKKVL